MIQYSFGMIVMVPEEHAFPSISARGQDVSGSEVVESRFQRFAICRALPYLVIWQDW